MSLSESVDRVVVPGEIIGLINEGESITLGVGLFLQRNSVLVTTAGVLRYKEQNQNKTYFVENNQRRYIEHPDDLVIGIITDSMGESWKVDIGANQLATLSAFAFEGATKRNRKNFEVGTLIYAMVSVAGRDMEPELQCMSKRGKSEGFGELVGGYMFKCSLGLARQFFVVLC
eukprot:TRINITY_DN3909_c0_g1_i1.p1 TRINITY_DN3909_c0_g1~~TRINITY_DN3909_c0_g1_i1.p1  ORF type:complete len:173 (-),score=34.20 TRINITY_DN3909_c0_g1_i1:263-781(-)